MDMTHSVSRQVRNLLAVISLVNLIWGSSLEQNDLAGQDETENNVRNWKGVEIPYVILWLIHMNSVLTILEYFRLAQQSL